MYTTEQIWEDFNKSLKAFIRYRIEDSNLAEDVLQEVFIKIHENNDKLHDVENIKSWIYQITRNTIIDAYRRQQGRREEIRDVYEDEIINELESSDRILTEIEMEPMQKIAAGLKEMVDKLPGKYAQALTFVEFEGNSQIELAKELGITVSGAKSRVQRGRLLLKDSLMKCCHFEFDRYGTIINMHPIACCCCHKSADKHESFL